MYERAKKKNRWNKNKMHLENKKKYSKMNGPAGSKRTQSYIIIVVLFLQQNYLLTLLVIIAAYTKV